MTDMLFEATRDHRGFAVIEPIEYRDVGFHHFLAQTIQMNEQIRPLHELVRACKLTSTDKGWFMVTPDGYQIAMTANAFKEFGTRTMTSRQPAIGFFPIIETNIGMVALTTRSDKYAMQPDNALVEIAQKVSKRYEQSDIKLATLSPDKVRFSVHLNTTTMGDTDDEMGTGFTIINSHTGQASVTVGNFIERLICTNGWVERIGGNTVTRTPHVWAGMKEWSLKGLAKQLASGEITSLPTTSKDYLEKGSKRAMGIKIREDVHKRIAAIVKSSQQFVDTMTPLAMTPISYDSMMEYTDNLLQVLTDETKAGEFEKRFGLKQEKGILRNVTTYSRSVRASAERLYDELSGTQWILPNVFNDQPSLNQMNLPLTVRDFAVELGSAIAVELTTNK